MEYYALNRYTYLKYYVLVLYYRLAEYPPIIRVWAVFMTISVILIFAILVGNMVRAAMAGTENMRVQQNRKRYYDKMKQVAFTERALDFSEIASILGLPSKFKMKEKQNRRFIPVLQELYLEIHDKMNPVNWQRMLQSLKMPAFFEEQVRSRSIRKRIVAFKNVIDIDADLKEAVASRYLFNKNPKLQMHARLHAARYGTSYPFKVLEEDPNLVFTQEMVVKYHNVLVYRLNNGLTMPNLIRWCTRVPINEELRIFAVNEIRLFKRHEDCAELLTMLKSSRDERFSCALIQALGELHYIPAEEEFISRYVSASYTERQVLAEALGALNSGSPEILQFLVDDFLQTTDYVSRMKLLRVIHDYGRNGKPTFERLKASANEETAPYFAHIECDLIDKRYA